MTAISIEQFDNGSHDNQESIDPFPLRDGWALVPDTMLPLENYPFGDAEIEVIDGTPVVVGWTPLPIPPADPLPPEPSGGGLMDEIFMAALLD